MDRKFSDSSLQKLKDCDERLVELCFEVLKVMDITILVTYRNEADQNRAYIEKKSKLKFPKSKHNVIPSLAVDCAPLPLDWNDHKRFYFMMGVFKAKADQLGLKIRLGGDFNNDNNLLNDSFVDLPHIELVD